MTRHRAHTGPRVVRVRFDFWGSAQFEFDADDPRYAHWNVHQMEGENGLVELARALAYDDGIPADADYRAENIDVELKVEE